MTKSRHMMWTGTNEFDGKITDTVVYVNPDNDNEWSSEPYSEQKKDYRYWNEVVEYMSGKYTLNDVYQQIQNKTCPLSTRLRNYVLSHYDENGKFKIK